MEKINAQPAVIAADAFQELVEFLGSIEIPDPTFVASYDPLTGEVKSVGPSEAFADDPYTSSVSEDVALDIIEGRTKITSCFVDLDSNEFEIVEVKNTFKIDDVLHRIPLTKFVEVPKPDLYVTYLSKTNKLKFQLSEELFGTKKMPKKFQPVRRKKTRWAGDTTLTFLITEYNDPHAILEVVSFTINDLIGNTKIIKSISVPEKFSIFTRRIFKNYVLDVK